MKKIWNIVAFLAVANILAIAGLVGWLQMTDRLSRDRVRMLRETFSKTVAVESQDKLASDAAAEKAKVDAAAVEKMAKPPVTAAQRIEENKVDAAEQLQVAMRHEKEIQSLRESLLVQMTSIEQREKRLKDERVAFEAQRKQIADMDGAAQFKSALATLEAQKPHDAKLMLAALMAARQDDQAVAYLARMEEGKRGKVLAEFVKEDPAVAAGLLERLRTRGVTSTSQGQMAAANETKPSQPVPSPER